MKNRGFTLIELLVVIAIIAILAAILFPVFAKARTAAKYSVDLGSQRQLGMALNMYADANGGVYPHPSIAGTLKYFPTYPVGTTGTTISGELIIALKPYAKNNRIFYCPAVDAYSRKVSAGTDSWSNIITYETQSKSDPPFMYIGYYYYADESWGGPKPIAQNGSPKRILASCVGGGIGATRADDEGYSGHGAEAVYTFADGHAKLVHHYRYPCSYGECGGNPTKLLMPKWTDE